MAEAFRSAEVDEILTNMQSFLSPAKNGDRVRSIF